MSQHNTNTIGTLQFSRSRFVCARAHGLEKELEVKHTKMFFLYTEY